MACIHPQTVYICLGCGKGTWYRLDHDTDDNTRPSQRKYVKMKQEPRRKWLQTTTCVEHEEKKLQKFKAAGAAAAKEFNAAKAEAAEAAAKGAFPKVAKAEAAKAFNAAKAFRNPTARVPSQCEPMMQSNQIPPTPVSWIAEPERKKLKKAQSAPW